jgi:pyridoxine 5'-phosphate synthase PdxJ
VYVKFKGPHTDLYKDNFITLGDTVTLTINVACKWRELSEPLVVDLTQTCSKLAVLLTVHPRSLNPHIQQGYVG